MHVDKVSRMRMRRLGAEGPEVSVVGLGCNNFGHRLDAEGAKEVVRAALDAGITLFDTADSYSAGRSEEYLGRALGSRRGDVIVATKWGGTPFAGELPPAPEAPKGSREYVRWACEHSLRRLGTDYIDLYQYHFPDEVTPIAETLGALAELVDEGKVRYVGSSNQSPEGVEEADRVARERALPRFVSAQNRYSLVTRGAEEKLLPVCERLGVGVLPYFPLESGLLTGKVRRGEAPPEGTRLAAGALARFGTDEAFDRVEALEGFADERGLTLLDVAIGGLAAMPAVASVIAGAMKPEQVRANAAAGAWEPSAEDVAALRALR
jgi:aryl-alcohol dehydrogenase-like predicted oxidoreductase